MIRRLSIYQGFMLFFFQLIIVDFYSIEQVYDSVRVEYEYEVNNVFGLNSKHADFSPVWYHTDLIFSSDREWDYNNYGESNWENDKNINLFKVKVNSFKIDSVVFEKPELFNVFLIGEDHVGPIAFNGLDEAVFSEVTTIKNRKLKIKPINPQLYIISIKGKKITNKEQLSFVDANYAYSQPTFSADGKQLYFVSNLPSEKAGNNIFVSDRSDGTWSKPVLVANLNSENNDMFPVIRGNKMFFSSDRSDGFGGLDLYESQYVNSMWTNPINLGSSINSSFDEFGMVFNPNDKSGYFSSNRENGNGSDDIYSFNLIEKVIVVSSYDKIQGQFEYMHLKGSPDKMEVILLDESGNIVSKTKTDENGNFVFNYLPIDQKYTIKVNDDGDVVLTLFNGEGNAILLSNENGEFVFRKLSHDGSSFMSLIDENDIDLNTGLVDFKGQFQFQKLNTEKPKGLKVYLIDEEGNIVMETTTDEFGNFIFNELPIDKNYIVRIDDDSDMILMVFNNVDHVVAMLTNGKNGTFIYRMLETNNSTNIKLITEEEGGLVFRKEKMMVSGRFMFENLDLLKENIRFDILDNEGHLLFKGETGANFEFSFNNLPLLENLIFKLDENSPYLNIDLKLNILNRLNESLIILEKDKLGMYSYKRMVSSKYNVTEINELETNEIVEEEHHIYISNYTIYYPNNGVSIQEQFLLKLDSMVIALKSNPNASIQVNGHASSLASEEYNMKLSQKRMKSVVSYLLNNGVADDRIYSSAFGESQLVNFCEDDKDCEDEMHRLNRRTELKIIYKD
jgi:outer membrane protein OmpA-like peptidoglycan-associated protein